MPKILVTGANGQVGSELRSLSASYPQYEFTFIDRNTLDLYSMQKIEYYFSDKTFDAIINCAAYTAVDKAEDDADSADAINHLAVAALARIAKEKNIALVHISTDYVFDGRNHRPYVETDPTDPQGVYGRTKRDGENAILAVAPANTVIIRTSWVYSSFGNNFLKTMVRLGRERDSVGVIFDQIGTPTYARDLAKTILHILPSLANEKPEIYHYSDEGAAGWYDFAAEIMAMADLPCAVIPIETAQYPTPATRPHYSLLNKKKIKERFGLTIPYWKKSLQECIELLGAPS